MYFSFLCKSWYCSIYINGFKFDKALKVGRMHICDIPLDIIQNSDFVGRREGVEKLQMGDKHQQIMFSFIATCIT